MKKLTAILFATAVMLFGGNIVSNAQGKFGPDSAECIKYLSYYSDYYKNKNYDQALPNWRMAYKLCPPQSRQSIFIQGSTLINYLIRKNASNASYQKALVDTLLTLQDQRAQYYPKYAVTAMNNKGQYIINYIKDNDLIYSGLEEIIAKNDNQTKPALLSMDLNSSIELYKAGKLDAEKVINTYQRNMDILDKETFSKASEQEEADNVKSDMESLFITSQVASCDNLIALFTPRFEANPNDEALVSNIVRMMSTTEGCTNNDLYLKAATALYKVQPSAQSAYFLYKLNAAHNNVAEAQKYMEEALGYAEVDNTTKAEYNYEYAAFCIQNNQNGKGYDAAKKAAELDPSYAGKSYFLIGSVWASTSCGGDEISRRAKYWVATDYMQKAKEADASLAEDCNHMIGQFRAYYPTAADAFMYDLSNGQSYTVSCGGMTATTTVRTNAN